MEYMISRELWEGLDPEEQKLWHSHDYEVHSGMLIMPNPTVPDAVWSVAERKEMESVVGLYGKTFHFWQIDRGDELPLGMPELMMSYTKPEQVPWDKVSDRDRRYKVDHKQKAAEREYIPHWEPHQTVNGCWK